MSPPPEDRGDQDWLDLFREGGPRRVPKEPEIPGARPAHRPKPWEEAAFRAWKARGRPTAGGGTAGTGSGTARAGPSGGAPGSGGPLIIDDKYFHIEIKVHSRGGAARPKGAPGRGGRPAAGEPRGSIIARIAYRTAERLEEVRAPEEPAPEDASGTSPGTAHVAYTTGNAVDIHDFSRKQGVAEWYTLIPEGAPAWMAEPGRLADVWTAVAEAETRLSTRPAEATEAREAVLALPAELDADTRGALAHDFAQLLVRRYGVIATLAIHEPSRGGDSRNHHAHVMVSDRRWGPEGFDEKVRELNLNAGGRHTELPYLRAAWASMLNEAHERAGFDVQVDHRSFKARRQEALARGDAVEAARWEREATEHMGPSRTEAERAAAREAGRRGEEPGPVTEMGRENAERRAASEDREAQYRRTREQEQDRERSREPGQDHGHGMDDDFDLDW